jgi:hypothetical protein
MPVELPAASNNLAKCEFKHVAEVHSAVEQLICIRPKHADFIPARTSINQYCLDLDQAQQKAQKAITPESKIGEMIARTTQLRLSKCSMEASCS